MNNHNRIRIWIQQAIIQTAICALIAPVSADEKNSIQPGTPVLQSPVSGLEADFLLICRIPATGSTDCHFIRYYVTRDSIRFVVMAQQPVFNLRYFPVFWRNFSGGTDPDGIWLRQSWNQLDVSGHWSELAATVPLNNGRLHYEPKEAISAPAQFESRKSLPFTKGSDTSGMLIAQSSSFGRRYLLELDQQGRILREQVSLPEGTRERTSIYTYSDTGSQAVLQQLSTELPPLRYQIPDDASVRHHANNQFIRNAQLKGDTDAFIHGSQQLLNADTVPYIHHDGGRQVVVQFESETTMAGDVTIPKQILVTTGNRGQLSGFLRQAYCLRVKSLSMEECAQVMNPDWYPDIAVITAIRTWISPHFNKNFSGPDADAGLTAFREFAASRGLDHPNSTLLDRIQFAGKNLDVEIYRHNRQVIAEWLEKYFSVAADSPFRKFQPELAVWLMRRIDACGTQMIYSDAVTHVTEQIRTTMSAEEILDSVIHIRRLRFAPFACFAWGVRATAAADTADKLPADVVLSPSAELSPQQRMIRAWLCASLLPSFRRVIRDIHHGETSFLKFDGQLLSQQLSETEITRLERSLIHEANSALRQLKTEEAVSMRSLADRIHFWAENDVVHLSSEDLQNDQE